MKPIKDKTRAEQQDGPNNQSGPIYGPITEKEHLRAIKHDAEKHLAAAYDKYKAAKDALPPEPSKRSARMPLPDGSRPITAPLTTMSRNAFPLMSGRAISAK